MSLERLHNHLIRTNLSRTRARDIVFLELAQLSPIPKAALIRALRPKVGYTTIYRTLRTFLRTGVVVEVAPELLELSDRFTQHHHFMTCRACGRRSGFLSEPIEHRLDLTGLCFGCADRAGAQPRAAIGSHLRRYPGQ